jgi:dTDP-3-amino-2,3,6-trideoxy-4-keto-D-glucose/dTDP-3-amino-3,4,6-trideoxy-alpha-D-glucose/dTDP-2,6-dideoxy-D-kanosamine transaminase
MRIPYNYLDRQFGAVETEEILDDLRDLVRTGEFTIGPPVLEFERRLGAMIGVKHVVGTNTGTDALILALKALGVGPGHEVITQVNTFYATAGAIVAVGARPVFVDVDEQYAIDVRLLEAAITPSTRAILPVHWTGLPADMPAIMALARRHALYVVEDACPATGAAYAGRAVGSFGDTAGFSMHPLKPLHVWGDGGAVVTNDDRAAEWLRLYRNHGMVNRDEIEIWGVNQRLQTVQAVVANRVLDRVAGWVDRRIEIAGRLDRGLATLPSVLVPPRPVDRRNAFQLYIVRCARRDELLKYLLREGVEAKVHYPIPLHLQPAARDLGYRRGQFPVAEAQAEDIVTLPGHQFLTDAEVDYMIDRIQRFYRA